MIVRARSTSLRPSLCASYNQSHVGKRRRLATAAITDIYDVVCIGGGPAGLSLLNALRSSKTTSHLRLALVESQDLDLARHWHLPSDQFSNRASSLTPVSLTYLSRIEAWSHIDASRVQPYHHMRVWDGLSSTSRISFDSPGSEIPIAHMTENHNLTRALVRRLDESKSTSVFDKTTVEDIRLGLPPTEDISLNLSSYPHIRLSSGQTIAARLLVGADGFKSPVRTFAGIQTRGWDYDRHGVVATLRTTDGEEDESSRPLFGVAYQRFLPSGPIALLPLPGPYTTLVWTTTPEQAQILKRLSHQDFVAMVNAAFKLEVVDLNYMFTLASGQSDELAWRNTFSPYATDRKHGEVPLSIEAVQKGSIASFPLRLRQATSYTTQRIALIGDAAHTIHPLAGQGLNMGLGDSQSLASAIETAVDHGADIGNEMHCLNIYNSDKWMSNNRMLGAVDKLHWLYSTKLPPIVGLRGLGLNAVDRLVPLKDWFMRQAGTI